MLVTHRRDRVQLLLPLIIVDCQPPIITIKPVSRAPFSSLFRNARSVVRTKRHDKFALFRLITIRFTFFESCPPYGPRFRKYFHAVPFPAERDQFFPPLLPSISISLTHSLPPPVRNVSRRTTRPNARMKLSTVRWSKQTNVRPNDISTI